MFKSIGHEAKLAGISKSALRRWEKADYLILDYRARDQWWKEEKNLRKRIDSLPRNKIVSYTPHPCNLCGESTYI